MRLVVLLLVVGVVLCFLAIGLGTAESPVFAETEFTQSTPAGPGFAAAFAVGAQPIGAAGVPEGQVSVGRWVHPSTTETVPAPVDSPSTTASGPTSSPVSTTAPESTALPESTTTTLPTGATTEDVDVVVYATQTSGLAAVRELALGAPHLRVALISCGNLLETPLTQGLSVEDARNISDVSGGFYGEWRQAVIKYYAQQGRRAFTTGGRFVYEPQIAAQLLWSYVRGAAAPNVLFYSANLVAANDQGDERYVDIEVEGGGLTRLRTRFFIDASVEADLARMLGADYRVGSAEDVFNDQTGNKPPYPSIVDSYATAPQRFSALLTLKVYTSGRAPRVASLVHPNYNPASYAGTTFAAKNLAAFGGSWSMQIAVLPNGKRELNETWSDWPDIGLSYQWVFQPEKRGDIRKRVLEWVINRVRYLQENGYPRVGIDSIPQKLYVREGPRIVGLDTYTAVALRAGSSVEPVAIGCYCEYDRHDSSPLNHIETTRYVYVPMKALMAAGHPALLMSTAVSTDCMAYSSAIRMEHTRANMGGAAAMIVIEAAESGVDPHDVSYQAVRAKLLARGYRLSVP